TRPEQLAVPPGCSVTAARQVWDLAVEVRFLLSRRSSSSVGKSAGLKSQRSPVRSGWGLRRETLRASVSCPTACKHCGDVSAFQADERGSIPRRVSEGEALDWRAGQKPVGATAATDGKDLPSRMRLCARSCSSPDTPHKLKWTS